jgi:hypothetical protein
MEIPGQFSAEIDTLAFEPPPERRMASERRLLHDDEAGALEVAHNALCCGRGHVLVSLVNTLAALKAQGKGDGVGQVARLGWRQLVDGIGHRRTIAR